MAPHNRGIVLDLVVFAVNLLLVRALGTVANGVVHAVAEDGRAKLAIGLFFTGLVLIQPVGPFLKRWSFHQRYAFSTESGAGCLVFWFMAVYVAMMFGLSAVAVILLSQFFAAGPDVGPFFMLAGFAWSIISVAFVYRFFMRPAKTPRWAFLTTPAAAHLGDACMYVNAIGLSILWGGVTSSRLFTEDLTQTPLGRPGSVTDIAGRLVLVAVCAAVLYLPARIYYLAEDKHRALTWGTMLLANLPLILRVVLAPAAHQ